MALVSLEDIVRIASLKNEPVHIVFVLTKARKKTVEKRSEWQRKPKQMIVVRPTNHKKEGHFIHCKSIEICDDDVDLQTCVNGGEPPAESP